MSEWHRRAVQAYFLETGKTQKEIASELGTTGPTVGRWMSGKTAISLRFQVKLEKLLGMKATSIPHCPLENSACCPVYRNAEIDFQSGEMWRLWSDLAYADRAAIVRIARKKLQKDS